MTALPDLEERRIAACLSAAAVLESGQIADEVLVLAEAVIRTRVREAEKGIVDVAAMLHAGLDRWENLHDESRDALPDASWLTQQLRRSEYVPLRPLGSASQNELDIGFVVPIALAAPDATAAFREGAGAASRFFEADRDQLAAGAFATLVYLAHPYVSIEELWVEMQRTARGSGHGSALLNTPRERLAAEFDLTDVERSVVDAVEIVRSNRHHCIGSGGRRLARVVLAASGVMPDDLPNCSLRLAITKLADDFHATSAWLLPPSQFWQSYPGA